jgi:hypothetical protein
MMAFWDTVIWKDIRATCRRFSPGLMMPWRCDGYMLAHVASKTL